MDPLFRTTSASPRTPGVRSVGASVVAVVIAIVLVACDVAPSRETGGGPGPRGGGSAGEATPRVGTTGAADTPGTTETRPQPAPRGTPLDAFRNATGWRDGALWVQVDVSSSLVTGTRRRISFSKSAVTEALLAHRGGVRANAAPMEYPDGTVFVAESLDDDGEVTDTFAVRIHRGGRPEYLLFGKDGAPRDTFPGAPGVKKGAVPAVCESCHAGRESFEPMATFPDDTGERRLLVESRQRSRETVVRFLEAHHRGDGLFGPYGALWISRLAADHRDGTLSGTDAALRARLETKYADLLGD